VDYLPEVWQPDAETRRLRELTAARAALMGDRVRIKNRLQSLLAGRLIRCPFATLFAQRSIAWLRSLDLPADDRLIVDARLRQLEAVEAELRELDGRFRLIADREPRVKLLMTLPGVSHASAVALLAALGDVGRFRDGDHAASYLGLVPSTRQSGGRCFHGKITKAGDPTARWMLTQGVQHLARHPARWGRSSAVWPDASAGRWR
jgi:transposase